MIQDPTLGEIGMGAFRARQWSDGAWCGNETLAWEAAGCAIRDAVMAHVINKIRLYSMLNAKSASAMEYSKGLQDYLCQASSEDDEAHHRFALHPVAAEDA